MSYSDFEFLQFESLPGRIMKVTLCRPGRMNATHAPMHNELARVWSVLDADPEVNVIVVTGAGERAFSSGGDIDWVDRIVSDEKEAQRVEAEAGDLVFEILKCEKPIVSAINGTAVGAGLVVALMADISIISDQARISDGHVKLGVAAGDHAAIIWPILCGMAKSKYYLMTADMIDGPEAERLGMVSLCVPHEQVMDEAMRVAQKLARGSQPAIRATKKALNGWMELAAPIFRESLRLEFENFRGEDAREGVRAFKEKRRPDFPSAR